MCERTQPRHVSPIAPNSSTQHHVWQRPGIFSGQRFFSSAQAIARRQRGQNVERSSPVNWSYAVFFIVAQASQMIFAKELAQADSSGNLTGVIKDTTVPTGYTVSLSRPEAAARIHAIVLIAIDTKQEHTVVEALARRHEIDRIFSVSGRYDLCALLSTESTQELDTLLDRMRGIKGVKETFSTLLLSTTLERPA